MAGLAKMTTDNEMKNIIFISKSRLRRNFGLQEKTR